MPDYRPDAPSVDLFTADEHYVLRDWYRVDCPRSDQWLEDNLKWNIPDETYEYCRIDVAVAQILLERIQDGLPQWVSPPGCKGPDVDRVECSWVVA